MNTWNRHTDDTLPPENKRILVSDGEVMVIALFSRGENHDHWIFDKSDMKDMTIEWWMELPSLPPKIVKQSFDKVENVV